jgi:iron complex outermembrane receptor protein
VSLFGREIDWDVGFAQNRVQSATLSTGTFNVARLAKAVGPLSQCTSPCVPYNFFGGSTVNGGGSITQDQLNYLRYEAHDVNQTNLRDWTANLSSDVYNLPAGPLGVAVGYERLDNYGYFHPDALTAATTKGVGPTNGRFVSDAEYVEVNIPLLADLPFVESLSVDVANRWSQFKRSGGNEGQNTVSFVHNSSGRLNIRYQATDDLLVRATWAQGFRSPDISELFASQSSGFPGLSDPCAPAPYGGWNGNPADLPQNCPNGTPDEQKNEQIFSTGGGNPNLQPESSISRTVGLVYSPSQVPGLDVNADYFKIELDNAIASVGLSNIVKGCFFNRTFCNLVTVKGNQITNVLNVDTNVGSILTEGIDVGLHYKLPSTPYGDFSARINGTFLKAYDRTAINLATKTGFATSHLAGVTEQPRRRFNGYLDWDYGNWSAQYHIEYYGGAVEPCYVAVSLCTYPNRTTDFQGASGQLPTGRNQFGATVYHDVNIAYAVPQINTTFSVGVQNLFDKKPPISRANRANNYDVLVYRLPSRLIYGDIRVRF